MLNTIIHDIVPKFWSVYRWWVLAGIFILYIVVLHIWLHSYNEERRIADISAIILGVIVAVYSFYATIALLPEALASKDFEYHYSTSHRAHFAVADGYSFLPGSV